MTTIQISSVVTESEILKHLRQCVRSFGTQKAVAEHYGISPQYLNDIFKKRRSIPDRVLDRMGVKRWTVYEKVRPEFMSERSYGG